MAQTWQQYMDSQRDSVNAILRALNRVERAKTESAREQALQQLRRLTDDDQEYAYYVQFLDDRSH
jgi:hypothetical protein